MDIRTHLFDSQALFVFAQFAKLVIAALDTAVLSSANYQQMASIICISIKNGSCCSGSIFVLNAAGIAALFIGSTAKATGSQIAHITSATFAGIVIVSGFFERYIFAGL